MSVGIAAPSFSINNLVLAHEPCQDWVNMGFFADKSQWSSHLYGSDNTSKASWSGAFFHSPICIQFKATWHRRLPLVTYFWLRKASNILESKYVDPSH